MFEELFLCEGCGSVFLRNGKAGDAGGCAFPCPACDADTQGVYMEKVNIKEDVHNDLAWLTGFMGAVYNIKGL